MCNDGSELGGGSRYWLADKGRVVSHFLVAAAISLPVVLASPVTKHSSSLHAPQITTLCIDKPHNHKTSAATQPMLPTLKIKEDGIVVGAYRVVAIAPD